MCLSTQIFPWPFGFRYYAIHGKNCHKNISLLFPYENLFCLTVSLSYVFTADAELKELALRRVWKNMHSNFGYHRNELKKCYLLSLWFCMDRNCRLLQHVNTPGAWSPVLITSTSVNIHSLESKKSLLRIRLLPLTCPGKFMEFLQIRLLTCKKKMDWFMYRSSVVSSSSESLWCYVYYHYIVNSKDIFF